MEKLKRLGARIRAAYRKLPDAWKAGIVTAWIAGSAQFALTLLGFIADLQAWAGSTDAPFPAVEPLGKAVASIVLGGFAGVINVVFRRVKPGPRYSGTPPEA